MVQHKKKPGTARSCLACQIPALKNPENMRLFLSDKGQQALCNKHKKQLFDRITEVLKSG